MKIFKTRDVKTPTRGTSKSAGIDFYVPNDFPGEHFLAPGDSVLVPSGIKAKIPEGYALIFGDKSGVATKKGLIVGAKVVDEDYQGEMNLHVINVSGEVTSIKPGEKLVQGLLLQVFYDTVEECDSLEELFGGETTERGEGGFGSTGMF